MSQPPRKRWRYYELAPSEDTLAVRIRGPKEALAWFGSLSTDERGRIIARLYLDINRPKNDIVDASPAGAD